MEKDALLIDKFNNETDVDNSIDILIELIKFYRDEQDNLDNAFKYAAIATISSNNPRADICCIMGGLYFSQGNIPWAIRWYKAAISNTSSHINPAFSTWFPAAMLGSIYAANDDLETAVTYLNTAKVLNPDYAKETASIAELI